MTDPREGEPTRRATKLSPHDFFLLDQWGRQVHEAFGEVPYLVGSVLSAEGAYRDVDVRMLLDEPWVLNTPRRRALNLGVTLWGRQATGLYIDFQFQNGNEFHDYDGHPRNPLGFTVTHSDPKDPAHD